MSSSTCVIIKSILIDVFSSSGFLHVDFHFGCSMFSRHLCVVIVFYFTYFCFKRFVVHFFLPLFFDVVSFVTSMCRCRVGCYCCCRLFDLILKCSFLFFSSLHFVSTFYQRTMNCWILWEIRLSLNEMRWDIFIKTLHLILMICFSANIQNENCLSFR